MRSECHDKLARMALVPVGAMTPSWPVRQTSFLTRSAHPTHCHGGRAIPRHLVAAGLWGAYLESVDLTWPRWTIVGIVTSQLGVARSGPCLSASLGHALTRKGCIRG